MTQQTVETKPTDETRDRPPGAEAPRPAAPKHGPTQGPKQPVPRVLPGYYLG